jgi:hypothetical protein
MPSITEGHYYLAAKIAYRLGDYRVAAPAILGQALTLQESDPVRAKSILLDVEEFIANRAVYEQKVSWRLRVAGVMRHVGQLEDAVRYHQIQINPLVNSLNFDPLEFYIQQNSWAAVLIEQGVRLDEAYYSIGNIGAPSDALALHDRHLQLFKLYIHSRDWRLAEHHYWQALRLCQRNAYDTSRIVDAGRLLTDSL